ncbi:MAG: hypothetical protein KIT16_12805 [Rhodospirillaceae bacterium]|nr:hypothetical protein [Rhodospirillaceae bacterium]
MRFGRYGKDDKRWFNPNARAILGLILVEALAFGLFALAFFAAFYGVAIAFLVVAIGVVPIAWLLFPLFRKQR